MRKVEPQKSKTNRKQNSLHVLVIIISENELNLVVKRYH